MQRYADMFQYCKKTLKALLWETWVCHLASTTLHKATMTTPGTAFESRNTVTHRSNNSFPY